MLGEEARKVVNNQFFKKEQNFSDIDIHNKFNQQINIQKNYYDVNITNVYYNIQIEEPPLVDEEELEPTLEERSEPEIDLEKLEEKLEPEIDLEKCNKEEPDIDLEEIEEEEIVEENGSNTQGNPSNDSTNKRRDSIKFKILSFLKDNPSSTAKEVANGRGLEPKNTYRNLLRYWRDGLVKRARKYSVFHYKLTESGRRWLEWYEDKR